MLLVLKLPSGLNVTCPKNSTIMSNTLPLIIAGREERDPALTLKLRAWPLIVCVISSKKNRTRRILKNKKFTKKTLNKIFRAQTSDKERKKGSQIIIYNNKTKKDFIFNIEQALIRIIKWEKL